MEFSPGMNMANLFYGGHLTQGVSFILRILEYLEACEKHFVSITGQLLLMVISKKLLCLAQPLEAMHAERG